MRKAAFTAAVFALLVAATAAASDFAHISESHSFDEKTTETKKYDLPTGGHEGRGRFRIRGRLKTGEIRLVVRDEAGNSHLSGGVSPDGTKAGEFDLQTGDEHVRGAWTVEVELKEATGHYEFTWTVD